MGIKSVIKTQLNTLTYRNLGGCMKKIILLLVFVATNAFAQTFTELRLGIEDNYRKSVEHAVNGTIAGNFKGQNLGLRMGYSFGNSQAYLEYNPEQDVEIKSANELAKVQSWFVGYRHYLTKAFFVGGQIGQSSFELVKGPNGVTFAENPKTEGITYGINLGYKHEINTSFYVGADLIYNLGNYKEDGPSAVAAVETIEIQYQSQINLTVGMSF